MNNYGQLRAKVLFRKKEVGMSASMGRSLRALLVCGFWIAAGLLATSTNVAAQDVSNLVTVTKSERSLTDLKTKLVTTTSTITVKNVSNQAIGTPLQAVFDISSASVQVLDAVAPGIGNPYDKYYVDLSTKVPGTLQPSASVTFSVRLVCPSTIRYSYTVLVYGTTNKVTPTITWATPAAITYGTLLSGTQLNATASALGISLPGSFLYTPAAEAKPSTGNQALNVVFTPTDTTNYATASAAVTLVVNKATPAITWANPAAINFGTALSGTQLNATASAAGSSVPGTFLYTPAAGTHPSAGNQTLNVAFTPTDTTNYATTSATVTLVVNKATPTIGWPAPTAIDYGTALSATQLNATASLAGSSVPGTFLYTPAAGTHPSAGNQPLNVAFTPTDTANYARASATVTLVVNKATPGITWANPAAIDYGTALSATQLNATATAAGSPVPGTFLYTPAAGVKPSAGNQTLNVAFTPTDSANYAAASATVNITVAKGAPAINWGTLSSIGYGTLLSATQLNASANVPGTFAYTPASGTMLAAGTQTLKADFTPDDTVNYTAASATASLIVNKATPAITWAAPASIGYGTPLSATQLDASANVPGSFLYTPATGTLLPVGAQTLQVDFTAADTVDYTTAFATVSIFVSQAGNQPPVANAGTNQPFTLFYGQSAVKVTLDGSGSSDPDGTIAAYTWSGTPKPANVVKPEVSLQEGTYTFTLTVTDNSGATSAPQSVSITVAKEVVHPPQITVTTPAPYQITAGSISPLNISVTASSPDGRPVALTASPQVANATFTAIPGASATGSFAIKPDFNQTGTYLVRFSASDSYGLASSTTIQIDVDAVNRPPVLTLQETATIVEGGVLTIPVAASDPDGDIVTSTATGLPLNAIFVPAANSITFTPASGQAGVYPVTVTTSDGKLAVSKQASITVTAAPGGGTGQEGTLTLTVDPVERISFLANQRVTGSVNSPSQLQPTQKSFLITGMSPVNGEQGATLAVSLTGDVGAYATHFANGSSTVSFGSGITVRSFTVTGPTQATATIAIDTTATVGTRSVNITTGSETAISVIAFNVVQGKAVVTGKLTDTDTGQPISGATAIMQGTVFSTTTGIDGTFVFNNVPAGQLTLLINATNHELVTTSLAALAGITTDIGVLKSRATVFDPSAPPSISLISIIGRGITGSTSGKTRKTLRRIVTDCWLLLGGEDAGVKDANGNQLNPAVTGDGILSLSDAGVRGLAESLHREESLTLQELLYAFTLHFDWSQGTPPNLTQWLAGLQQMVNSAWADPTNPDSALAILVFNKGTSVSPNPPTLSAETSLNVLQANILAASFYLYALDPAGNQSVQLKNRVMLAYNGDVPGSILLASSSDPINPGNQGRKSTMRNFWKQYFSNWMNTPIANPALIGVALSSAITLSLTGGFVGAVVATATFNYVFGQVANLMLQAMVPLILGTLVPTPPVPIEFKQNFGYPGGYVSASVCFNRSSSDHKPYIDAGNSIYYIYTLYRYDQLPGFHYTDSDEDLNANSVDQWCSNCPDKDGNIYGGIPDGSYTNDEVCMDDFFHNESEIKRLFYYDLTVTRLVGWDTTLTTKDGTAKPKALQFFQGAIPGGMLKLAGKGILGTGTLFRVIGPAMSLANGMKQLTSDFSQPLLGGINYQPVYDTTLLDGLVVNKTSGVVYYNTAFNKSDTTGTVKGYGAIYSKGWLNDNVIASQTQLIADTGFSGSPKGLAIDSLGNLYTDNHASDMDYGGRLFRFTPSGTREYVGNVNYYSLGLMMGHPADVSSMTMGGLVNNNSLTVVDELDGYIKEVPVTDTYDPNRRVGQPVTSITPSDSPPGSVKDIAINHDKDKIYLLNDNGVTRIDITLQAMRSIEFPDGLVPGGWMLMIRRIFMFRTGRMEGFSCFQIPNAFGKPTVSHWRLSKGLIALARSKLAVAEDRCLLPEAPELTLTSIILALPVT